MQSVGHLEKPARPGRSLYQIRDRKQRDDRIRVRDVVGCQLEKPVGSRAGATEREVETAIAEFWWYKFMSRIERGDM